MINTYASCTSCNRQTPFQPLCDFIHCTLSCSFHSYHCYLIQCVTMNFFHQIQLCTTAFRGVVSHFCATYRHQVGWSHVHSTGQGKQFHQTMLCLNFMSLHERLFLCSTWPWVLLPWWLSWLRPLFRPAFFFLILCVS